MNKANLIVLGLFSTILGGAYLWARPDASYSGVVLFMIVISLLAIGQGLFTHMKIMGLSIGFMFMMGSIFMCMQAKDVREATESAHAIIAPYPDVSRTTVIPSTKNGVVKKWRIKTDNSLRSVISYYTDPEKRGE